jgi:hypothetical protein
LTRYQKKGLPTDYCRIIFTDYTTCQDGLDLLKLCTFNQDPEKNQGALDFAKVMENTSKAHATETFKGSDVKKEWSKWVDIGTKRGSQDFFTFNFKGNRFGLLATSWINEKGAAYLMYVRLIDNGTKDPFFNWDEYNTTLNSFVLR